MKSHYSKAFTDVAACLRLRGILPEVEQLPPATAEELCRFQQVTGVELPGQFIDFYTTFANGYVFRWADGDEEGCFSMPNLESLAALRNRWIAQVTEFADAPNSMDQCMEPEYRAEAFRLWRAMKHWLPFIEEPDGDSFCVDLISGAIVFDKHDWFDGFGSIAETNGLIVGETLLEFILNWGRLSFRPMWFTDAPHPASDTHLQWL